MHSLGKTYLDNLTSISWIRHSGIYINNNFQDSYYLRIDFNNNKIQGYIYYDGLIGIDLTAAFGAGNETSQANIDYFDGTTTVYK